jgi:hypothetical protein
MAGINEEVAANKPGVTGPRPDSALACDEEADPAAEYMAVRRGRTGRGEARGGTPGPGQWAAAGFAKGAPSGNLGQRVETFWRDRAGPAAPAPTPPPGAPGRGPDGRAGRGGDRGGGGVRLGRGGVCNRQGDGGGGGGGRRGGAAGCAGAGARGSTRPRGLVGGSSSVATDAGEQACWRLTQTAPPRPPPGRQAMEPGRRRVLDPLAPVDHASAEYEDFGKDFYTEQPAIANMTLAEVGLAGLVWELPGLFAPPLQARPPAIASPRRLTRGPARAPPPACQVNAYRRQLDVRVAGFEPPRPVQTFGQCGFEAQLLAALKRAGYDKPTAIQAQALPAALSGRDVLVRRQPRRAPRPHPRLPPTRRPAALPLPTPRPSPGPRPLPRHRALPRREAARPRRSCFPWSCTSWTSPSPPRARAPSASCSRRRGSWRSRSTRRPGASQSPMVRFGGWGERAAGPRSSRSVHAAMDGVSSVVTPVPLPRAAPRPQACACAPRLAGCQSTSRSRSSSWGQR